MTNLRPTLNLKTAIEERRAARSFSSTPVQDEILQEIFRLGVRSPSGFNLQPWRFIVVRDPEHKQTLRTFAFDQRQVTQAPIVLICCGDRRVAQKENIEAVIKLGKELDVVDEDYANYVRNSVPQFFANQPSFDTMEAWTNRHTMLAVAHLMIVAKSFGVDSCPMEGFNAAQVKEGFKIPAQVDVCCLLPMGYAAEPFKGYGGRFNLEQVFYSESYGNPLQP